MIHFLESAVARLYTRSSDVVGAGVLVSDDLVLTCAHVISAALGLSYNQPLPADAQVQVDFPLLTEEFMCFATVTHFDMDTDVAGLHLTASLPAPIHPTPLVRTDELWRHAFGAVGFPTDYDAGVWASGILLGRTAGRHVQLEDVKVPGYAVQGGFSGTPVWDEQLNSVVGIVTAAESDSSIKAAFMIPTDELIAAWPALAAHSLAAGSRGHLQVRLTRLEKAQCQAANPTRFQSQIDTLRERLAKWDKRIKRQRERISEGLDVQRQQLAAQRAQREKRRLRVVGAPPLDVTDYFKDRREDLRRLGQLLSEPTTRLVSVIGHGGMGKTALACKILRDLERQRWSHAEHDVTIDGIIYLSTRTTGISLERLFLDCAKLLEDEERERLRTVWTNPQLKTADKITRLLQTLRQGRYVILLDNLEDLLDDQGRFTDEELWLFFEQDLLRAPGTQLVVTTRIPLALRREIMRFDQKVELLEGLPLEEGVALLRELDPNGEYGLRDTSEAQLRKAVELTHGVPRALEVLAGILANDPFATLDEVLETFYTHEDVVRALIEEHYKRLDRETQRVIDALAVFKKPVPPLAVDFFLEQFEPGVDVPSIMQRLVHANIVSVNRATKAVTLHHIDQDYAYNQLPDISETETKYTRQALELRAADYYVQIQVSQEVWESIDDLEPQLNEFEHRIRAGDHENAFWLLDSIDEDHLALWGHYDRLADMRLALQGHLKKIGLQVVNLRRLGYIHYNLGQLKKAFEFQEKGLIIARQSGIRKEEMLLLYDMGQVCRVLRNVEQAHNLHRRALSIAQELNDSLFEGRILDRVGIDHVVAWQYMKAIRTYEDALRVSQKFHDSWLQSNLLSNLGNVFYQLGRINQGIAYLMEALDIALKTNYRAGQGMFKSNLGFFYAGLGETEIGSTFLKEALAIARKIGQRRNESVRISRLADIDYTLGQIEKSIIKYREALQIAQQVGSPREEGKALLGLCRANLTTGEIDETSALCKRAIALNAPRLRYAVLLLAGIVCIHCSSISNASQKFGDAIHKCETILSKTPGLFELRYALSTALVGQAVCSPDWTHANQRSTLLAPALREYQRAIRITAAPGAIQHSMRDLELVQAAGIEGLEPVFDLLESAEYEPDIPEDLPDLNDLIG
jgi:tetratricopeptide (TPR) repeat protein